MGGWGNTTYQGGWRRVKQDTPRTLRMAGRWTTADVALTIVAFAVRWELGLAVLAFKLWHQASAHPGSLVTFAREKWDALVGLTRSVVSTTSLPFSVGLRLRSSGSDAFDAWRQSELGRIDAERERLRAAEFEFMRYRDELLHATDRQDFDRFMQTRGAERI